MALPLAHYFGAAAVGAAAGFVKPLWFISTGYGAAMALQSALALGSGRAAAAAADPLGRLHLAAIAAYGVRLATFVLWRDGLPSFQTRKAESDAKLADISLGKKLGLWASVVPLYGAMFVPAFLNSAADAGASASAATTNFSLYVGAPLMLAALVWEAVADYQQQKHYERQAAVGEKKPCTRGLWRFSRQANYFGEAAFWVAGYATAARALTTVPRALGAAIGAVGIVGIIAGESKRRAAARDKSYSGAEWEQYKRDTAQIVPFVHCIKTGGGAAAAQPGKKAE